jgi:16S rRNA (uracil1498-N3)-methyltransferase
LRFKAGNTITASNGKGLMVEAVIESAAEGLVQLRKVQVLRHKERAKYNLHIAMSPLKNASRFEWFVEKAVELRVTQISPLICSRTEKQKVRIDRLKRIALEAMKQSASLFLTEIREPVTFNEFVNTETNEFSGYIAACTLTDVYYLNDEQSENLIVMIGPEGDFTQEEIHEAVEKGYKILSLGSSRLRTETAGVFAAASMYFKHIRE